MIHNSACIAIGVNDLQEEKMRYRLSTIIDDRDATRVQSLYFANMPPMSILCYIVYFIISERFAM